MVARYIKILQKTHPSCPSPIPLFQFDFFWCHHYSIFAFFKTLQNCLKSILERSSVLANKLCSWQSSVVFRIFVFCEVFFKTIQESHHWAPSLWVNPCVAFIKVCSPFSLCHFCDCTSGLPKRLAAIQGTYTDKFSMVFQMQNGDEEVRTAEKLEVHQHFKFLRENKKVLQRVTIYYNLNLRVCAKVVMRRICVSYYSDWFLLQIFGF